MKIVESWLKEYLPFRIPPDDLARRLGELGLEVASVDRPGDRYRGFVVGHVVSCEKHPRADRLTVCRVDVGHETLQIVCGAPNIAAGQKVAVGLVGAEVRRNQHDPDGGPFTLSHVTLRGVASAGMICSEYELDLGADAEGILVLDATAKTGTPLARHFGLEDVVYDIEITPNRPDWLSHFGVAREVAVLVGRQPRLPAVQLKESAVPIRRHLAISVKDADNCPRFAAKMIRGLTVGPSPAWLQQRLRKAGLRPINNIVDITNYVMYECGHPMHAFDYDLLRGGEIVVRQARQGSAFTTLDGKRHDLPPGTVMVCDAEREVSIAGVMGGENSEIRPETINIVLEAAYWKPSSIRRTSKALAISTDASQRFERGTDPNAIPYALARAASLVLELAGGTLLNGTIDVYPRKVRERIVPLRPSRANAVLGTSISPRAMTRYLKLLGIEKTGASKDAVKFRVPTYRVDVEREIDLIEEVARVHGYNNIGAPTVATVDFSAVTAGNGLPDRVREVLIGMGYNEILAGSMHDERRARLSGKEPVKILNPLNKEMQYLRPSLVPGLLECVTHNIKFGNRDLRLFEIGHVFSVDRGGTSNLVEGYREEERVAFLLTGRAGPRHWSGTERWADIYDLKGAVGDLLERLSLDKAHVISYSAFDGLTEDTLAVEIHGATAGTFGRVRSEVVNLFGIEQEVFVAELDLRMLKGEKSRVYRPLPRYPKVSRDVAFVVSAEVPAGKMVEVIRRAGGELLQQVEVFDVYQGDRLPQGKKSLAFSLELLSREGTLVDAQIDAAVQSVVRAVEGECGATLRSAH